MDPIFSKLVVSIHEAGHAIANHFFGRATEKIVLTFQPDSNEWHGETHAVPPKAPAQFRTNFTFGSTATVEPATHASGGRMSSKPTSRSVLLQPWSPRIFRFSQLSVLLPQLGSLLRSLRLAATQDRTYSSPSLKTGPACWAGYLISGSSPRSQNFQSLSQLAALWLVCQFRHGRLVPEIKGHTAACGIKWKCASQRTCSPMCIQTLNKS